MNPKDLPLYEQVCPTHPDHGLLEQDVLPLLRIENENNLNKRYTYLYKVDPNRKTGKDIKVTYGYDSRVPLEELKKKRQEFWGRRDVIERDKNRGSQEHMGSTEVCMRG